MSNQELRDTFAAAALTALLSKHITDPGYPQAVHGRSEPELSVVKQRVAIEAYDWADAMLKARTDRGLLP